MHVMKRLTAAGMPLLLLSAPVSAHIGDPGAVLPHFLTGEHLLVLVIVGICVAGIDRYSRRKR